MPLFEFICRHCNHEFETLVMGADKPRCPKCGSEKLAKQMSSFRSRVKGGEGAVSSSSRCSGCSGGSCSSCG